MDADSTPLKHCPKCEQWKPATKDFFTVHKQEPDGLYYLCIVSKNAVRRALYRKKHPLPPPDDIPEGYRRCSRCNTVKLDTPAHFRRGQCRECLRELAKDYRAKYLEECLARSQAYRKTHREASQRRDRAYYAAHKEQLAATSKNYYKEHKEEIRKRNDAWIVANRERYRAARREHDRAYPQQRRAWSKTYRRKHHDDHTFPLPRPDARDSIDHLVITCKSCNQKKSSKYPWEFFEGGRLL